MKNYKAENLESRVPLFIRLIAKISIIHYPLSIIHFKNYVKSSNFTRRQRAKRA
jgi:hypothetical protein